jgi:uncharacterized repeat protein (TIGR01451 family)
MIALILLKLLIFKNLNSMMRLFFISCLLFVCLGGAFGQDTFINDTLDVQWDSLKMPKTGPSFERYYRSGKKLFALDYARTNIYGRGGTARFYESSDDGKIWKEKKDHIVGEIYVKDSIVLIARCLYKSSSYYNNFEYVYGNLSFELSEDFGVTYKTVFNKHVLLEKAGAQIYPGDNFDGFFEVGDSSIYCSVYGNPSNNEQLISNNRGKNWSKIDAKLFYNSQDNAGKPFSKIINGKAYLITNDKIYSTRNSDFIWTDSIPLPQEMPYYYSFSVKDNIYTLYCYNRKKMSTNDNGINWRSDSLPFTLNNGDDVFQKNNKIYIKLSNRIYQSDDGYFNNYQRIYPPNLPFNQVLTGFSVMDSVMYLNGNNRTLIKSKDNGQTWETIDDTKQLTFSKFAFFGENVLLRASNGAFYQPTQGFKVLTTDSTNLSPNLSIENSMGNLPSLKKGKTWLMASSNFYSNNIQRSLFRSLNNGFTWDTLFLRGEVGQIIQNNKQIFIFSNDRSFRNSFYLDVSSDSGRTFINSKLPTIYNYPNFFTHGDTLFLFENDLWYSIDAGSNWQQIVTELPTLPSLQVSGSDIFHDGNVIVRALNTYEVISNELKYKYYFFASSDLGETWIQYGNVPDSIRYFHLIGSYKGYLFYPVFENNSINLMITGDYGLTWTAIKKQNVGDYFSISENFLYTVSQTVIFRTSLDSIINKVKAVSDYSILKGQIFKDKNENCQKDTTENGIAEKTIRIMPRNYTTITDKNGRFAVALPPDTYTISTLNNVQYHKAACGDTILKNITLKANEKRDTQIVFKQSEKAYDLSASLTTGSRARPGFEMDFVVKTQNLGTENIDSALITLDMPSNLEFKEANQNGIFKNNQIVWILKNSGVDDNKTFTARLRLAPTTPLSIPLVFKAKATIFNQKDTFPLNNIDSVRLNVTGSFDPNDKTVLPEGKIPFFTNELDYLIRFQNTGNDTAFKVVVVDTLPPQLDVVSLKTISASHPYVVSLKKNIITFTFDNILLPDSNVNERASHGFIRFKLKPQNGLKVGDNINNKAAIYFDYNKPIITNIAQLELIKPMIIVPQNKTLCKGDSYKSKLYFDNTTVYDTTKSLLYDTTFITAININPTYQISKDTILKANEKLFNKHVENGEIVIVKLNTISGCDSSIIYKVSKLSTKTQDLPEGFLSLKIYPNPVKDYLSISYELNKITFVEIALYNSIGQKVKILREKRPDTEGGHRMTYDAKDIEEGWYQMTIETEQGVFTQRFIKIK